MIHKINAHNITPILPGNKDLKQVRKPAKNEASFNNVLQGKLQQKEELKYSKHADFRMRSLGIINNKQLQDKLQVATNKARSKGIKEGLILEDNHAYLVSVTNNTVITVVDLKDTKDNVFTNIDGAVII